MQVKHIPDDKNGKLVNPKNKTNERCLLHDYNIFRQAPRDQNFFKFVPKLYSGKGTKQQNCDFKNTEKESFQKMK
jgi:hypothetical protein